MVPLVYGTVPPHFHDAIEIIFTTEGYGTTICNGVEYRQVPGSAFFASSNEIHYCLDRTEDIAGFVIDIEPSAIYGTKLPFDQMTPISHLWKDPQMQDRLWDIVRFLMKHHETLNSTVKTALTSALVNMLLEHIEFQKITAPSTTVKNIIDYCQAHCTEPLSLDILSQELSLSVSHISRIFSNKLKISFSDYINSLRLSHAINLLDTSDLTITKVATYSGFPTIRTFNRIFTEQYGVTPSQYRKKQK